MGDSLLKTSKKFLSVILAFILICCAFTGCSKQESNEAQTITSKTMLIAYTQEAYPFVYTDSKTGELTGFDVELIKNTFESFKGEFKDYKFIKVDENYALNEDVCFTDEEGNDYSAIIMCGGLNKNTGTVNKDYNWSKNIIENKIITVVKSDSNIKSYADLKGCKAAIVSETAQTALNKNANIKNSLEKLTAFDDAAAAFKAMDTNEADAVIIDSFNYYTYEKAAEYTVLNGSLDIIEYGFGFSPKNDYSGGFNEAVKEMLSPDYGEGDTLTPIIENYFNCKEVCAFTLDDESEK